MKNILVTGGAGFIGSHTAKELARRGFRPVVFDSFELGRHDFVKWGPFVHGELQDRIAVEKALKDFKIEGVIHFAAYAYVGESVKNPEKYYENNVAGSLALFSAMRRQGVNSIVFSSSCATYGLPNSNLISESHVQSPINPYGSSKLMVETILRDYKSAYGFRPVILRYFNACGSDSAGDLWEAHSPETHLIPNVIRAAFDPDFILEVFGNDYPTADGTCIRDYVHVSDLANAHVLALKYLEDNEVGVFNLGCGAGVSVMEVIRNVEEVFGRPVKYRFSPRRDGDPPVLVADPILARDVLGWKPRYSSVREMIETINPSLIFR